MKISNFVLSLAIAGLCLNQASAQGDSYPTSSAASRSVGDSSAELRPTQFNATRNLSDYSVDFAAAQDESVLLQGSDSDYQASYVPEESYGTAGAARSCYAGSYCMNRSPQVWFNSETLLWFTKSVASPPLVNTSGYSVLPVTGGAGVQSVFGGGDGIDYGLTPGFRISGGMYLGEEQKVGIGGRVYGLFNPSDSYSQASNGSGTSGNPSIGIPFYNLDQNQEDAFLVAYQNGIDPTIDGTVAARSDLDMYGADGSLYLLLTRSDSMRMDLLGGYTYNLLKNSIGVETTSSGGNFTTTNDLFATKNTFNGGHLGVLSSVNRSRVSFSTLAKVAFGSMQQSTSIRGFSTVNGTTLGAGILTQPSNIGEYSRDTFAFIPELGVKLGFAARENVQFTVGYTMMMWSGVALAGSSIDNAIDPAQLVGGTGTRPNPILTSDTFWMQGVDLGMNFSF
ncbi:MAG: BBP7 family outer membrane beta-barrel protein [Aureliella sp.]